MGSNPILSTNAPSYNFRFDADISKSISGRLTAAGERTPTFGEWMRDYLPAVEPALLREDMVEEEEDDEKEGEL